MTEDPLAEAWSGTGRAIGIALRTAHLFAMALFVGGVHLGADVSAVARWRLIAVLTGAALLVVEASHGRHWLLQVRGIATLAHAAALALLAFGGMERSATALALVLGGVGSHAPKAVRKFSPWRRRVLE